MTGRALLLKNRVTDVDFPNRLPSRFKAPAKPPTSVRALRFWLLFFGVGVFGSLAGWATVSPIQSAVVASGTFEVEGDLQVVEHLEGGMVKDILVKEGDEVEAGQIIAVLDSARVDAQSGIWRSQLAGALARLARLRAEADQADAVHFSPELLELVRLDPFLQSILDNQSELFASNLQTDSGQRAILNERIAQLNEQLLGIEHRRARLEEQRVLVHDEAESLQVLYEKGLTLKSRIVERREDEIILSGRIGQAESERQSVLQQIAEVEERKLQVGRERRQTIANEQQTTTEQIFDVRLRMAATEDVLERQTIRAPIAGRIHGFDLNTIGAVVEPGQGLLKIVPRDSAFIVEAQVRPSDIDEVILAGPARIRLSAYSFRKTPPVQGMVSYIAADATYDSSVGQSYYQVHLTIPEQELANLPDVRALPGMPVQVMMATGEQTILTYLLDPVIGGIETAMVEGE